MNSYQQGQFAIKNNRQGLVNNQAIGVIIPFMITGSDLMTTGHKFPRLANIT